MAGDPDFLGGVSQTLMGVFTSTKQFRLGLNLINPWWLSGASIDLDFDNGRYYDSSLTALKQSLAAVTDYLSCTRASIGYAKTSGGVWTQFANNVLRITDLGLLIEDARTNYLLQSETPATQTTASLSTGSYTLWVEGTGSATPSNGSGTITGGAAATAGSPNTFTVTVAGTVVVTVAGSLTRFQLENGPFSTSYILTTVVSATRAADSVTCAGGLSTILAAYPQSIVIDAGPSGFGATGGKSPTLLFAATSFAGLSAISSGANISWSGTSNSGPNIGIGSGLNASTGFKAALGQDASFCSLVAGNGTVASNNAFPALFSGTQNLGSAPGAADTWFGYLRRVTVWNSRLADATLKTLSAP